MDRDPAAASRMHAMPTASASLGHCDNSAKPEAGSRVLAQGILSRRAVSATVVKPWRTRWLVLRPGVIEWFKLGPKGGAPAAGSAPAGRLQLTAQSEVREAKVSL